MFVDRCIQDCAVAGGAALDLAALPHQAAGPAPRAPLAPPPVRALLKTAGEEHQAGCPLRLLAAGENAARLLRGPRPRRRRSQGQQPRRHDQGELFLTISNII